MKLMIRGGLSISQKQGVITLIEKEGKDPLHVNNYRPITLLNVDYKILSKVLANRIKEVLGEIVHNDQVGYIKDRNIGEAVRLIDDMFFILKIKQMGFWLLLTLKKLLTLFIMSLYLTYWNYWLWALILFMGESIVYRYY